MSFLRPRPIFTGVVVVVAIGWLMASAFAQPPFPATPTGRILHLTDLHFDELYHVGSPANCVQTAVSPGCCHVDSVPPPNMTISAFRNASKWGDFNCDTPLYLIDQSLAWMATAFAADPSLKPDLIVWTGDDPSHDYMNQTLESNIRAVSTLTALIKKYFPGIPCFPVLGNHDTWPVDQLGVGSTVLLPTIATLWADWLDEDAQASFRFGGYYSMLVKPGWRIIGLNSLYYEKLNYFIAHNISEEDAAGQWAWFVQTLERSRAAGEKVWIIAHIPASSNDVFEDFKIRYQFIVQAFAPDVITGQLFGHTHKDEFHVIPKASSRMAQHRRTMTKERLSRHMFRGPLSHHRNLGDVTSSFEVLQDITISGVMFVAPSIMPDDSNPSFRLYEYDPQSTEIVNWFAYRADLEHTISTDSLQFSEFYNMKEGYRMKDLSASSFSELVFSMWNNQTVFDEFRFRKSAGVPIGPCSGPCHVSTMCSIQYLTTADKEQCSKSLQKRY